MLSPAARARLARPMFRNSSMALLVLAVSSVLIAGLEGAGEDAPPEYPHWVTLTEKGAFGERDRQAAVSFNGKMWLMGGHQMEGWAADVWSSVDGAEWKLELADAPWGGRSQHCAVVHDGKMWVLGGYNGALLNDVWSSEDGVNWEQATEAAPWSPRIAFCAVSYKGRIFVMGGQEDWRRLNDVWASEEGVTWELVTEEAPWVGRSRFAATVHNDLIYILGGSVFEYESWFHTIYGHYIYKGDVWSSEDGRFWDLRTPKGAFGVRSDPGLVSMNGYLWLVGGDLDALVTSPTRTDWFSKDGSDWKQLVFPKAKGNRNLRRTGTSTVLHDGHIWTMSGALTYFGMFWYSPQVLRMAGDTQNPEDHVGEMFAPILQPFDPGFDRK